MSAPYEIMRASVKSVASARGRPRGLLRDTAGHLASGLLRVRARPNAKSNFPLLRGQ